MTRPYQFQDSQKKQRSRRPLHPIWRGIGFIIMIAVTVGAFWLAGVLLELNYTQPFLPFPVPRNFVITVHEALPTIPGKLAVQFGATLLISLLTFSLMVVAYGIINPVRLGETDAPPPRGRGRRRSRIR